MTINKSGSFVNFLSPTKANIRSLKVHFSPKQEGSGDPSPENVRPINGHDSVTVHHCGKNLCTAATGTEMVEKWGTGNASRLYPFSNFTPGQEYTLSASFTKPFVVTSNRRLYLNGSQKANTTSNAIFCGPNPDNPSNGVIHNWVDTDGTLVISHNNRGLTYTEEDREYAASLQKIQLEFGSKATSYEPYNGTDYNVTFPEGVGTNIFGGQALLNKFAKFGIEPDTTNKTITYSGKQANEVGVLFSDFESGQYTIMIRYDSTHETINANMTVVYKDGTYLSIYANQATEKNNNYYRFVTSSSKQIDHIACKWISGTATLYYEDFGVFKGNVSFSKFEPYSVNTIYGGYIDLVTGEIVKTHQRRTYDGSSDESWALGGTGDFVCIQRDVKITERGLIPMCNKFVMGNTYTSSYPIRPQGNKEFASTVAEWRTWLASNPIDVVYELATPIHYQLSPTALQTLINTNNFWSNADSIDIEYELSESQEIILAKKRIMLDNQPHRESISANAANFATTMTSPLKDCKVNFLPKQPGNDDPSPDNIRQIEGWNEINVTKCGKNIAKYVNTTSLYNINTGYDNTLIRSLIPGVIYQGISHNNYWIGTNSNRYVDSIDNGAITFMSNDSSYGHGLCIKVSPNTKYSVSYNGEGIITRIAEYDKDGKWLSGISKQSNNPYTFTTNINTVYVLLIFCPDASHYKTLLTASNIQIEQNQISTEFEPYNGDTISVSFQAIGKNLWTYGNYDGTINGIHFIANGSEMKISGTNTDGSIANPEWNTHVIRLPAGTYTVSSNINDSSAPDYGYYLQFRIGNLNGQAVALRIAGRQFTLDEESDIYCYVGIYGTASTHYKENIDATIHIQIEKGSTVTEYEPFNNTIYGGYVDFANGEIVQEWKCVDLGTLTWGVYNNGTRLRCYDLSNVMQAPLQNTIAADIILEKYTSIDYNKNLTNYPNYIAVSSIGVMIMYFDGETYPTGKMAYKLIEPIHYPIDSHTLRTLRETNNIYSDTNGLIDITYWTRR